MLRADDSGGRTTNHIRALKRRQLVPGTEHGLVTRSDRLRRARCPAFGPTPKSVSLGSVFR